MKRIYFSFAHRFKIILYNSFAVLNKLYLRQYKVINFILYIILGIISYFFLYDLTLNKVIQIFIFTLISFAISMYISDNYTLSKNLFIKLLQKLVFSIMNLSLIVFILDQLNTIKNNSSNLLSRINEAKGQIDRGTDGAYDSLVKIFKGANELIEMVEKDINANNYFPGMSDFYQFLDSLSLLHHSSLLHICIFILLVLTVINIVSTLFGNELIKYFKLEEKFPRLSKFFKLRVTLQKYYLMWNVIILFLCCIVGIGINILIIVYTI